MKRSPESSVLPVRQELLDVLPNEGIILVAGMSMTPYHQAWQVAGLYPVAAGPDGAEGVYQLVHQTKPILVDANEKAEHGGGFA